MHIETLSRLYYLRHSFDRLDVFFVNSSIRQLSASILNLNPDEQTNTRQRLPAQEVLRSTFILCASGLCSQAKNHHICTLVYYGLQNIMRPEDVQLLLKYTMPPTEVDMPSLTQDAILSWPLPIIKINESPEWSALNRMVREYEKMQLGAMSEPGESEESSPDPA
ncbi:hypothetical protein B0J11DRAFT_543564 [Dendryphion nanum]|uniref:Uncharacterized protein n=1 Tax=Dendryphion nanum TaxID=256645 RepID=A0A9P9D246_9PLEO|nr:hypothetical protein B0J11DRAFT_543564 [Dendryphion nanum]